MAGSNLILINRTDLDSGNDGTGSGADPTAGAGAVIDLDEQARMALFFKLGIPDATAASTDETLATSLEISDDGGSTWDTVATLRDFLGAENPTSADEEHPKAAVEFYVPRAQAGQNGVCKARLNITASDTDHWAPYADIRTVNDVREEWLANAQIKTPVS